MFACSFIFTPGSYDEEFHRLDKLVMDYAEAMPGYLGVDRWFSEDRLSKNVIYYFKDQESVREFATFSNMRSGTRGIRL